MTSLRDVVLVARFELFRAIRTWRALALIVLYVVASCGGAYVFTRIIGALERELASQLGVPATDTPGTMLAELMTSDLYLTMISNLTPSVEIARQLVAIPPLATWHLWLGLLLVPFFAASASAEAISIDLASRALRFEAMRTGRLELVLGRATGQIVLTAVAHAVSLVGVWIVGMVYMVGNDPIHLASALVSLSFRAWAFGLPFIGIGIACSQLTASPAWARVLAIGVSAGSFVAYGLGQWMQNTRFAVVGDILLQVLPQGWIKGLWLSPDWMVSSLVMAALAMAAGTLGFVRFSRRDL